jgi:hypothetical protein
MNGQPEYTPDPGAVVRMPPMPAPPQHRRAVLGFLIGFGVLVALLIGIAIGRATGDDQAAAPIAPVAASDRGRLKVVSIPADGNVVLDGRFVGVAPLEGLDLDPGKHTIVIDVFGYQPYAGTVEIEPRASAKLSVALAPLGATEGTVGNVSGGGTATRVVVPRSALAPATGNATAAEPKTSSRPATSTITRPPPAAVFQRPRRDCSGENRTCRDGCSRADSDCRFSCPGCTSCLTSVGWDECRRQCDSCRNGCEQNKKFCESSCSSQNSNCERSQ